MNNFQRELKLSQKRRKTKVIKKRRKLVKRIMAQDARKKHKQAMDMLRTGQLPHDNSIMNRLKGGEKIMNNDDVNNEAAATPAEDAQSTDGAIAGEATDTTPTAGTDAPAGENEAAA